MSSSMDASSTRMNANEIRASVSLASIFGLRMLGLFLILPVFAIHAKSLPGGDNATLVGLAMGMYGLTQAIGQIPFGIASDRHGRKRIIIIGLVLFILGALIAAIDTHILWVIIGRAVQGAGAVSAAVTALIADSTRDEHRTKAMALVGASIGLMFALSLVLAPLLAAAVGLSGLFAITGTLALLGGAVVVWGAPAAPTLQTQARRGRLAEVLRDVGLLRLNLGVFVLHAVQLAMWVAVPALLVQAGLPKAEHWHVYLPAVLGSFVLMGGMFALERRGHLKKVFLAAILLIALVEVGLLVLSSGTPRLWPLAGLLFVFFCGFNVLEATQPSLVSRLAPMQVRGTAMGVYNTLQSLGFFVGGWMGGSLVKSWGSQMLFLCCAAAMLVWWGVALPMQAPGRQAAVKTA